MKDGKGYLFVEKELVWLRISDHPTSPSDSNARGMSS